jgi:FtsP/CotA-like multicopper oxidase with cupredoxin domain
MVIGDPPSRPSEGVAGSLENAFEGYQPSADDVSGEIVDVTLAAEESEIDLVSGAAPELNDVKTRVWAYNGQVPGPELRVRLGDTLRVTLENRLPADTTIHWHGVRVPNPMDGVPGVTQPPVGPGESFVYEFTPPDAGTYWYHPHVRGSEEVERGLYGVLIVEDPAEPTYSQDVVWVLDDWLIQDDGQIYAEFNTPRDLMHDGRWGNFITVNGRADEVLAVQPGERVRLRLLNTANGRIFIPDFSGLDARVIAYDGMLVAEPFVAPDGLELAPGNRIDLDLTVATESAGQRIEIVDRATGQPVRLATVEVGTAQVAPADFDPPRNPDMPDWTVAAAIEPDGEVRLSARQGGQFGIEWLINGQAYPTHEPIPLPYGSLSKLRFINESGRLHPMHIHGQFFRVLSRDGQPTDEQFWRDTVLVYPNEVVDIGLIPIDYGRWATHCHILEHAEAGMMTVAEVR